MAIPLIAGPRPAQTQLPRTHNLLKSSVCFERTEVFVLRHNSGLDNRPHFNGCHVVFQAAHPRAGKKPRPDMMSSASVFFHKMLKGSREVSYDLVSHS